MKKPLIGITLDEEETKTYSKYPWYAARKITLNQLKKLVVYAYFFQIILMKLSTT